MGHFRDATRARRPGGCASRRRRGRIWRRRRNKTAAALGRRERRRDGGRGGGLTSPRSHTMPPDRPAVRRFVAVAAKGCSGGARSGGRRAESTGRAVAWLLRFRGGRRATARHSRQAGFPGHRSGIRADPGFSISSRRLPGMLSRLLTRALAQLRDVLPICNLKKQRFQKNTFIVDCRSSQSILPVM